MRALKTMIILLAMLSAVSCQWDELVVESTALKVTITEDSLSRSGEYYKLMFYDRLSGRLRYTDYAKAGTSVIRIPAGEYNVLAYNFDLTTTFVKDADNYADAFAELLIVRDKCTEIASYYGSEPAVVESAESVRLGVAEGLVLPHRTSDDNDSHLHIHCSEKTTKSRFVVSGIKHPEYLSAATVYITGTHKRINLMTRESYDSESVTVQKMGYEPDTDRLSTNICYLGMEDRPMVILMLVDRNGKSAVFTRKLKNEDGQLSITINYTVPEPVESSEGLLPVLNEWDTVVIPVKVG